MHSESRGSSAGPGRRGAAALWALVCLAACAVAALAVWPSPARAAAGGRWVGAAPPSGTVQLALPMKAHLAGLERFAAAVSRPGSPRYGRYEPISVLARRFGAPAAERHRVVRYLRRAGATGVRVDVTGLFADATMGIGRAQRLFGTSLSTFRSGRTGRFVAPAAPPRIPAAIRSAVTGVVGLDTRPVFRPSATTTSAGTWPRASGRRAAATTAAQPEVSGYPSRTGTAAGCAAATGQSGFTPNQYLAAYGYDALHSAGLEGQGERVALIEIDGFKDSDLRTFARCFGLGIPRINGYGVGLRKPLPPGGESTLDLEVLDAAAPRLRSVDVYESRPNAGDVLRSLTAPLSNRSRRPDVISASLGSCEPATRETIGSSGLRTVEGSLAMAAASGISVLASSGDDGSSSCMNGAGQPLPLLAVSYPASSPWVTGVGGTNVTLNAANHIISQQVWNDAPVVVTAGGGGQSQLFRRPAYQNQTVTLHRRIVPDVSMLADVAPGYEIYCSATRDCVSEQTPDPWSQVGGTSAAAPLLAGGLALVDERLRQEGRQNIGLANPLLYRIAHLPQAPDVISDIVSGDNDLGASTSGHAPLGCCSAVPGFDAASGLGSVNVAGLALMAGTIVPRVPTVKLVVPRQRHPVASRRLRARVSCSARCLLGSYARIRIGRSHHTRTVRSTPHLLRRAGRRTVQLTFAGKTLRALHGALARHRRITATVYGAVLDPAGGVMARTRGVTIRIRH